MKRTLIFIVAAAILNCPVAFSQVNVFPGQPPTRSTMPARVDVPADVAVFLQQVADAYASPDSKELQRYMASDFLYQGMNEKNFLQRLTIYQKYLGKLEITPITFKAEGDTAQLVAFGVAARGVVPWMLIPLNIGSTLIKENGAWKLRGNQRHEEAPLFKELAILSADFTPSDTEAYKRLIPSGYSVPEVPFVQIAVANWLDVEPPLIPYREVIMSILVRRNDENIWYMVSLALSDLFAVKAGRTAGYPKFLADIDVERSSANRWKIEGQKQATPLFNISFEPAATAQSEYTNKGDASLLVEDDKSETKLEMTPLGEIKSFRQGYGWMTVNMQESPWKDLIAPGSKAAALTTDFAGGLKLNLTPLRSAQNTQGKQ